MKKRRSLRISKAYSQKCVFPKKNKKSHKKKQNLVGGGNNNEKVEGGKVKIPAGFGTDGLITITPVDWIPETCRKYVSTQKSQDNYSFTYATEEGGKHFVIPDKPRQRTYSEDKNGQKIELDKLYNASGWREDTTLDMIPKRTFGKLMHPGILIKKHHQTDYIFILGTDLAGEVLLPEQIEWHYGNTSNKNPQGLLLTFKNPIKPSQYNNNNNSNNNTKQQYNNNNNSNNNTKQQYNNQITKQPQTPKKGFDPVISGWLKGHPREYIPHSYAGEEPKVQEYLLFTNNSDFGKLNVSFEQHAARSEVKRFTKYLGKLKFDKNSKEGYSTFVFNPTDELWKKLLDIHTRSLKADSNQNKSNIQEKLAREKLEKEMILGALMNLREGEHPTGLPISIAFEQSKPIYECVRKIHLNMISNDLTWDGEFLEGNFKKKRSWRTWKKRRFLLKNDGSRCLLMWIDSDKKILGEQQITEVGVHKKNSEFLDRLNMMLYNQDGTGSIHNTQTRNLKSHIIPVVEVEDTNLLLPDTLKLQLNAEDGKTNIMYIDLSSERLLKNRNANAHPFENKYFNVFKFITNYNEWISEIKKQLKQTSVNRKCGLVKRQLGFGQVEQPVLLYCRTNKSCGENKKCIGKK